MPFGKSLFSSSSSSCLWRIWCVSCSLYPQNEIGPSISSSVVLCSFVLLRYIVTLVFVFCLCPSSVHVVATFPRTILFPLLYSVLPFFSLKLFSFSLSSFVIPSKWPKKFICAASKSCSSLFFSIQVSLPNFNAALAVMLWILNFVSLFIYFPKCLRIAPFVLLKVCNLSSKSLLYSDIRYPRYLKSVTCSIILSFITIFTLCMWFPHIAIFSYFQICRTYRFFQFRSTTFHTFEPNYIP